MSASDASCSGVSWLARRVSGVLSGAKGGTAIHRLGSVLALVGIAALMLLGFVVLMTALTYDAPVKFDRPRDPASAGGRRAQWRRVRRQVQQALSAGRSAARELVELGTRAIALAKERWPRLRHYARDARRRWLTLESTTGQLIATTAGSVVVAYLIVTFG